MMGGDHLSQNTYRQFTEIALNFSFDLFVRGFLLCSLGHIQRAQSQAYTIQKAFPSGAH